MPHRPPQPEPSRGFHLLPELPPPAFSFLDIPTFDVMWLHYAAMTGLAAAGVPAVQYRECRRAFYSGLANMFGTIARDVRRLPEGEQGAMFDVFSAQVKTFADEQAAEVPQS